MINSKNTGFIESVGVAGAPFVTWEALQQCFDNEAEQVTGWLFQDLSTHQDLKGQLILVTDRQGDREHARYGVVIQEANQIVVSCVSFGPRFGAEGTHALQLLVHWATERGLVIRETVIPSSDLSKLMDEPDQDEITQIIVSSNPADAAIYV